MFSARGSKARELALALDGDCRQRSRRVAPGIAGAPVGLVAATAGRGLRRHAHSNCRVLVGMSGALVDRAPLVSPADGPIQTPDLAGAVAGAVAIRDPQPSARSQALLLSLSSCSRNRSVARATRAARGIVVNSSQLSNWRESTPRSAPGSMAAPLQPMASSTSRATATGSRRCNSSTMSGHTMWSSPGTAAASRTSARGQTSKESSRVMPPSSASSRRTRPRSRFAPGPSVVPSRTSRDPSCVAALAAVSAAFSSCSSRLRAVISVKKTETPFGDG
jgi:hypothetical protein